jgi:hypothetical protein
MTIYLLQIGYGSEHRQVNKIDNQGEIIGSSVFREN